MSKKAFSTWVEAIQFVGKHKGSYIAGGITEGWFVLYPAEKTTKKRFVR